jgi:shikimate dehydrogenase
MISGTTEIAVMLGHPVQQVRTPEAFNAWARDSGRDVAMIALDTPPERLHDTLVALSGWQNCIGAVVTYPHKQAVLGSLATSTDEVAVVGAANVIRRGADGALHGGMTDGLGFVAALRKNGYDPARRDVRLIGAGGAGSAIALALLDAGVRRILIHDIDAGRRSTLIARLAAARPNASLPDAAEADFDCALVVNATPVGMNGDPAHPFPLDELPPGCCVADIVPSPAETAWLTEARRRGHPTQTGPEMVACQLPAVVAHLLPDNAANGAA